MSTKPNITPLNNRVVVKPSSPEQVTKSGIIIPDTASKEKPAQGEVVAIGPGGRDDKGNSITMTVKVGDTVLFSKYSPDEVVINNEDYLIMREDSILAIINK